MPTELGEKLKEFRDSVGVSLRAVEKETGISNAYLSQLERGVAKKPTPEKLKILAEYYRKPYMEILSVAGYLPKPGVAQSLKQMAGTGKVNDSELAGILENSDLTDQEEKLVEDYIEFLMSRRA